MSYTLIAFFVLMVGGIALALVELFFTDRKGPDHYGDIHGNTSGKPRVMGYLVVGALGFIALMIELAIVYGR